MELDHWHILKQFTHARIAMGRAGDAMPTNEVLKFRMAHALARDAVNSEINTQDIVQSIELKKYPYLIVHSQAANRHEFLLHPSKGRLLDATSVELLKSNSNKNYDLCIVVADGLSAGAINQHALKTIDLLYSKLPNIDIAPIVLAQQGRVAISDQIGELLHVKVALILIGERPGLSTPNSMGAYITYNPKTGNTDEKRNCISNIQPDGLSYEFATAKIAFLIRQMLVLQLSGVKLKDNFDATQTAFEGNERKFNIE